MTSVSIPTRAPSVPVMSLHFDSFDLDYLQPLSFHSSAARIEQAEEGDESDERMNDGARATHSSLDSTPCYADVVDDEPLLEAPSSPFPYSRDLSCLVSPSPAPSSTSCGSSSGDSLYDSNDELSSQPSAAPYLHSRLSSHTAHSFELDAAQDLQLTLDSDEHTDSQLLTDKYCTDFDLLTAMQHQQHQSYQQAVYGLDEQCDETGLDVEMDAEDESEVEEETATPALAAVPPAQIVQATVADPSFVPNPAFFKLSSNHSTGTAAVNQPSALTAPSASPVDQQHCQPIQLPSSPVPSAAASLSKAAGASVEAASVIKPKRKYTKRAKHALPDTATTATATNCDVSHTLAHAQPPATCLHSSEGGC